MAATKAKFYRCTERSKCELAKNRVTIDIINGKRSHPCPLADSGCERNKLREIEVPRRGPSPRLVAIAVVILLVIGLAVLLWPRPMDVETALTEVWPWLKP